MRPLLLIRHARTGWNEAARVQGRTDIPLSVKGRDQAASWRLPGDMTTSAEWFCSPLQRACETARLLGCAAPRIDDRLTEMSWGDYEGCTIDELRQRLGSAFTANERRGLDFSPPGGESPRAVAARLASFLHDLVDGSAPAVIVAHKGLLRASIVLACGWDMLAAPPVTIEDDVGLLHGLAADGRLSFLRSVPLLAPS